MKKLLKFVLGSLLSVFIVVGSQQSNGDDPVYNTILHGMVIQTTTNLLVPFSDAAIMPDTDIEVQSPLPFTLYLQTTLSIVQSNQVFVVTPALNYSFSINEPFSIFGDMDTLLITNPPTSTLFFRWSFEPTNANLFYVNPITFGWTPSS
jgi:hypothetical protein